MSYRTPALPRDMIPINKPWMDEQEKREVASVLDESALTSAARDGGKRVRDFESQVRSYLGVKHVLAVNSGTAALHAALLAAGIKQGDEVLLPSFTFVATANAVVASGATPVFVDVKRDDYTMDASDMKSKITKNSRAVIPVHLYGHPADMDEISELADKHSIELVEDACQSLGSTYKNRQTGTFGSMGCFSMYASKVLTAGEGGAIATNSDELADKIKMIRNHGMVEGYDTRVLGLNLRLPELSAAVAKVQMQKLHKMLDLRRRNAEMLSKMLYPTAERHGLKIPRETADKKFNWYLYTVALDDDRDGIKEYLSKIGVGATIYYDPPVHKTPYYMRLVPKSRLPNTEWCAEHVLSLPVHPHVTEEDVERIAGSVKAALEG
ncbi:MAG: DegT/DnrJ/EryC1/StrS family aminotransferase [Nitrososphaera sp.]